MVASIQDDEGVERDGGIETINMFVCLSSRRMHELLQHLTGVLLVDVLVVVVVVAVVLVAHFIEPTRFFFLLGFFFWFALSTVAHALRCIAQNSGWSCCLLLVSGLFCIPFFRSRTEKSGRN